MNSSDTLRCAQESSQLAEEVSQLVNKIIRTEDRDDYAISTIICPLREKLVKMQIHIGRLVNELKWQDEVSKRWKLEKDRVIWMAVGVISCGIYLYFIRNH